MDAELRDLDRIRFVTRHVHDLQGLQVRVPAGLAVLSLAFAPPLGMALLLAALLTAFGARHYYRRAFGRVEPLPAESTAETFELSIFNPAAAISRPLGFRPPIPRSQRIALTLGLVPVLIFFFQLLLGPPWIRMPSGELVSSEWSLTVFRTLPIGFSVPLLYLLCGSLFLAFWFLRERRRSQSYDLILGVLLLGFSIRGGAPLPSALLFCGAAMMLGGALDHWQLLHLARPLNAHEEEQP